MKNLDVISENKFKLSARGNHFTIERQCNGKWLVIVVNASVRAYSNGIAFPVEYDSLDDVEKRYKSLKGISSIVKDLDSSKQVIH